MEKWTPILIVLIGFIVKTVSNVLKENEAANKRRFKDEERAAQMRGELEGQVRSEVEKNWPPITPATPPSAKTRSKTSTRIPTNTEVSRPSPIPAPITMPAGSPQSEIRSLEKESPSVVFTYDSMDTKLTTKRKSFPAQSNNRSQEQIYRVQMEEWDDDTTNAHAGKAYPSSEFDLRQAFIHSMILERPYKN